MTSNDRSVNLADLAARARSAPTTRRSRSDCRNPECNNGMTPGLVASGGGSKAQPLFGAGGVGTKRLMRWSWVPCLACNAPTDARKAGAVYKVLNLSDTEIAQRASLANSKAPYTLEEPRTTLSRAPHPMSAHAPENASKLNELIEQNKQLNERLSEMLKQNVAMTDALSRMSMQVTSLLEDNAKLRLELAKPTVAHPPEST